MAVVVPSGFQITSQEPIDARITVVDQAARLALNEFNVYPGLIVYQQSSQELYVLNDTGSVGSNSGWSLISGSAGSSGFAAEWSLGASGNTDFVFSGDGFPNPTADPEITLVRGQDYKFANDNPANQHPFQIQTDAPSGGSGTPYNSGVTNNGAAGGAILTFNVPFDAPDQLYYQCTSHPNMSGSIRILSADGGSGVGFPFSGSAIITGSLLVSQSFVDFTDAPLTASIISASDSIIGSLLGTASTASYVETAQTASYVLNAVSSSYALTASYAVSASHEIIKELSSSYADTASYVETAQTASYVTLAQTASYVTTAQTASYVLNAVSSSYAVTASYAISASHEIVKEVSSSYADSASLAVSASFVPFDGNRAVTNQDQPVGIRNVNFGANGLTDFIEKVYFANTAPSITTTEFRGIAEFTPSGSLIGTINTSDAEGQLVTVQTQSSYTADQFRIEGTNQLYLNVAATESMNTDSSQGYNAAPLPIRATDTLGLFTDGTIYIEIIPNSPPTFRNSSIGGSIITGQTDNTNIPESSANGVKRTIYYADANGDTVTINTGSLSTEFETDFQININSGLQRIQIEQINNVDFDTYPTYSFVLTASDEHYPAQDPEAVRFLTCSISVVDNTPPNMSNQSIAGVNENINVNNGQGGSAGNYINAGQVIATGPEVGDTLTFTNATLAGLSVDGVNVPLASYGGTSQSDPTEDAFEMSSTGYFTRRAGVFINSDLIDSYVYSCSVQDNYDPTVVSASVEIPIADDVAPAINVNWSAGPYINESSLSSSIVTTNSNGVGNPFGSQQAQFTTNYSVPNETVSWQLNPATPFALDSSQRISANANISESYFSPATIDFSITASNTFGTENKQAYSVTVTDNQAPTFNISNVGTETDDTTAGSNVINVTNIQDVERNLDYTVSLSGTDAALFNIATPTITTNGGSTFLTAVNDIPAGTYSINVIVTDNYGSSRTTAHSITITQSATYGPMYVYTANADFGSGYFLNAGFTGTPANGAEVVASTGLQSNIYYPLSAINSDGIAQSNDLTIYDSSAGLTGKMVKRVDLTPSNASPSVQDNIDITINNSGGGGASPGSTEALQYYFFIPSGSAITGIPSAGMAGSYNAGGSADKGVMYIKTAAAWSNVNSTVQLLDFGSAASKYGGYRKWYVIGITANFAAGSVEIKYQPENVVAPT